MSGKRAGAEIEAPSAKKARVAEPKRSLNPPGSVHQPRPPPGPALLVQEHIPLPTVSAIAGVPFAAITVAQPPTQVPFLKAATVGITIGLSLVLFKHGLLLVSNEVQADHLARTVGERLERTNIFTRLARQAGCSGFVGYRADTYVLDIFVLDRSKRANIACAVLEDLQRNELAARDAPLYLISNQAHIVRIRLQPTADETAVLAAFAVAGPEDDIPVADLV